MNPLPPETAEPRSRRKPNVALWALAAVFACFVVGIGVAGTSLYPMLLRARAVRAGGICMRRLQRCARAMSIYAADNDDTLPDANAWMDRTGTQWWSERAFRCPEAWREKQDGYGYAMNIALSRKKESKIADSRTTPLVFDSSLVTRNAGGGIETLPKRGRHTGANNVAYADGHVTRVRSGAKP